MIYINQIDTFTDIATKDNFTLEGVLIAFIVALIIAVIYLQKSKDALQKSKDELYVVMSNEIREQVKINAEAMKSYNELFNAIKR
tara:strand:- start:3870 stop:4124 length:255 start_codon:yes stop_codon:yes gene_type:complete